MAESLFIATERFDPTDGEAWQKYFKWAKIPALKEVVSLDILLCNRLVNELSDEDWNHAYENYYFKDLDYLTLKVKDEKRKNILGLYRNPNSHISAAPAKQDFSFIGYDLIEDATQISALTNCGGFPDVFSNEELNLYGLISKFERASEVKKVLIETHPKEAHAHCEMYAIWRLNEQN